MTDSETSEASPSPLSSSNNNDASSSSSPSFDDTDNILNLRVKSIQDVSISLSKQSTVQDAKQAVREALGVESGRYLRLIASGRLLAPDTAQLHQFSIKTGDVLHAVLAAAGVRGGQQAALSRASSATTSRRYRGTGVGLLGRVVRPSNQGLSDDDESSDEEDAENPRERLGFDRLRSAGMSRHEITAIRSYFSRSVDRYVEQHSPSIPDTETDLSRRRLLQEDAWMQAQGPASEFRLNLNQSNPLFWRSSVGGAGPQTSLFPTRIGTDRDFLWGFLLGFFVGFLMLVWVWMPTVPHKQKLGILTGISLQLALTLLKNSEEEGEFEDGV